MPHTTTCQGTSRTTEGSLPISRRSGMSQHLHAARDTLAWRPLQARLTRARPSFQRRMDTCTSFPAELGASRAPVGKPVGQAKAYPDEQAQAERRHERG